MPRNPAHEAEGQSEVMASIDGESDEFVIADISREDAWLSISGADAPVLEDWC